MEQQQERRRGGDGVAVIKDAKYSDLTITLTGCDASFRVHKIYLAMASPVLEEMIDSLPPLRQNHLLLHEDAPSEAFHWLMRFVHRTDPPMESSRLALKVACLVGKYRVKELYPACLKWLEDILKKGTLLEVYNAAYLLRNSLLVTKCLQMLLTCAEEVLSSQQVCCLTEDALRHLLKQHLYVQSEAVILNAVLAWGRAQLRQQQGACGEELHQKIKHVLPHVRLLTLSTEEIVRWLVPSGVYSAEESQAILMHRTQTDGAPPLPETCSSLLTKRRCLDSYPMSRVRLPEATVSRGLLRPVLPLLLPGEAPPAQERVLVSGLRVDAAVVLQRVECRGVALREVRAAVRDATGRTLYTSAMAEAGEEGFDVPVALDPSKACIVTATLVHGEDCCFEAVHSFSVKAAGVLFTGEQHCLLPDGCDLYFWRLDHCLGVDL
ncbi:uncharacterized protein LOC126986515 [Eriocheir sinensis]|uniref:uncharacterized protein LOC126986515 n=1 Tax=Eriocheir sinensis TaxID=95602 RepID=UPI0021C95392|nr:uncharacterized protein LOC126986515 [Eriocheir sinensis]